MITKMASVLTLFVFSYVFLVFFSDTLFKALICGFIFAQSFALLVFTCVNSFAHLKWKCLETKRLTSKFK